MGTVRKVDYFKPASSDNDLFSCLTAKQQEVVRLAKHAGYYDYPRKTCTKELAKQLGISPATTIEHLRKAENRLIEQVVAGR